MVCVTVDEPWDVFESWWGYGVCDDCGRFDRVLYEGIGPDDEDADYYRALDISLNDGVLDWTDEGLDLAEDLAREIALPEVESTIRTCPQCLEAQRWLSTWCHSWMYGIYREDIISHWEEQELAASMPLGRLVVAAKNHWRTHKRRLMTPEEVAALVDASLDRLRRDTGQQHAA